MEWFTFSLYAIILFSVLDLVQRIVAVQSIDSRSNAIVFNVFGALISLILTLTFVRFELSFTYSIGAIIVLILGSLFYGGFERLRFIAAKKVEVSILAVIYNFAFAIAFFVSFILYKETLTFYKVIGFLLIIFSIFLVSFEKKGMLKNIKYLFYPLLAMTFLGLAMALDKKGAYYFSPAFYNILVWILPLPVIIFPLIKMKRLIIVGRQYGLKLFSMAFLNVVGYYFYLKALNVGEATVVIPVIHTSAILTSVLGIVLLKERERIPQKLLAILLAFIGSYFMMSFPGQ